MTMTSIDASRPTLGGFMSLMCFQYLRVGTEEVADRAPVVASGRKRGYDLVEGLGLLGSMTDGDAITQKLNAALGVDGTRLCLIQSITSKENGSYEVRIKEGACTAGTTSPTPHCAFTLGVFIGALHALTGMRMRGVETECIACGAAECIYQIEPV